MKNGVVNAGSRAILKDVGITDVFSNTINTPLKPSSFTVQNNARGIYKPVRIANNTCLLDLTTLIRKIKSNTDNLKTMETAISVAQGNFHASGNETHRNIFIQTITSYTHKLKALINQTASLLREIESFKLRCPKSSTKELDTLADLLKGLPEILGQSEGYLEELKRGRQNNLSQKSSYNRNYQPSNSSGWQNVIEGFILIKNIYDALKQIPAF
jgi:hypothetical protein